MRAWATPQLAQALPDLAPRLLTGPTGERNTYQLRPRPRVLCLAADRADRLTQLAAVLAVGAQAVWPADAQAHAAALPATLNARITLVPDWRAPDAAFDAVLLHGDAQDALAAQRSLAQRPGPLVGLTVLPPGGVDIPLERLLIEHSVSVNTAAAGGNASLMTLA